MADLTGVGNDTPNVNSTDSSETKLPPKNAKPHQYGGHIRNLPQYGDDGTPPLDPWLSFDDSGNDSSSGGSGGSGGDYYSDASAINIGQGGDQNVDGPTGGDYALLLDGPSADGGTLIGFDTTVVTPFTGPCWDQIDPNVRMALDDAYDLFHPPGGLSGATFGSLLGTIGEFLLGATKIVTPPVALLLALITSASGVSGAVGQDLYDELNQLYWDMVDNTMMNEISQQIHEGISLSPDCAELYHQILEGGDGPFADAGDQGDQGDEGDDSGWLGDDIGDGSTGGNYG